MVVLHQDTSGALFGGFQSLGWDHGRSRKAIAKMNPSDYSQHDDRDEEPWIGGMFSKSFVQD